MIDQTSASLDHVDHVDYDSIRAYKEPLLAEAAQHFLRLGGESDPLFKSFIKRERAWLEDAALFYVLTEVNDHAPWWRWPQPIKGRRPDALESVRRARAQELLIFKVIQFFFDTQWRALKAYAEAHDVKIIGDLPIYIDHNSADVWTHPDLFQLDEEGRPLVVSGVPPDTFSETGQLWGNPIYDWSAFKETGYRWWADRLRRALELTHSVRVDHFRAFSAYWEVPYGSKDARVGQWVQGPGVAFFEQMRETLGALPMIAEDLGLIDQAVTDLVEDVGLPGMKVLQFAFGEDADQLYLPHHHKRDSVIYTGTHDNDTTLGWWESADEQVKNHVRRYFGVDGHDIVWDLIRATLRSVGHLAVLPMQDILTLGSEARMNRPSLFEGNWRWRMRAEALNLNMAHRLKDLILLYDRGSERGIL